MLADWQISVSLFHGQDEPQVGAHSSAVGCWRLQQPYGHGKLCHVVQRYLVHEQSHLCEPSAVTVFALCCGSVRINPNRISLSLWVEL